MLATLLVCVVEISTLLNNNYLYYVFYSFCNMYEIIIMILG